MLTLCFFARVTAYSVSLSEPESGHKYGRRRSRRKIRYEALGNSFEQFSIITACAATAHQSIEQLKYTQLRLGFFHLHTKHRKFLKQKL